MADPVRIVFLGGLGEIGRNCAAIEVADRIMLLVDCGLMFPDADMLGIDLVLPDFTHGCSCNADRVEACVLTHGHEDHVGALSFLLRELSFPIYGSALTLGLARHRIEEAGLLKQTELIAVADGERRMIGPFDVEFIPVTHSVPHGFATAFHTPQGTILHTGDFKLDLNPVDGRLTDLARIGTIATTEGIRLLMADSTNAEEHGYAPSETSVGRVLHDLFHAHSGRRIVTACFASHIHRIQQIADAAIASGRVVATLGLSMRKNVRIGPRPRPPEHPRRKAIVDIEDDRPDLRRPARSASSPRGRRASRCRRWHSWPAARTAGSPSPPTTRSSCRRTRSPATRPTSAKVIDGLVHAWASRWSTSGIADVVHATGHAKAEKS